MNKTNENIETIIINHAPKGAIIFLNYKFSMTGHINPSTDKHAAIYFGYGSLSNVLNTPRWILNELCEDVPIAVDATYKYGVRIVPLSDLLTDVLNAKIYVFTGLDSESKMSMAANSAIGLVGTPYGFKKNNMYCFKLIADCYNSVGVSVSPERFLWKEIFLGDNFTKDDKWEKLYDSLTGELIVDGYKYTVR